MNLAQTVDERMAAQFEARVKQLKALIEQNHKFDWPYTDAFDDSGRAFHEAKRRVEAEKADRTE